MMPTASRPFHARHCEPTRNSAGPIPCEAPLVFQRAGMAFGNRTMSVIGIVVALPA